MSQKRSSREERASSRGWNRCEHCTHLAEFSFLLAADPSGPWGGPPQWVGGEKGFPGSQAARTLINIPPAVAGNSRRTPTRIGPNGSPRRRGARGLHRAFGAPFAGGDRGPTSAAGLQQEAGQAGHSAPRPGQRPAQLPRGPASCKSLPAALLPFALPVAPQTRALRCMVTPASAGVLPSAVARPSGASRLPACSGPALLSDPVRSPPPFPPSPSTLPPLPPSPCGQPLPGTVGKINK